MTTMNDMMNRIKYICRLSVAFILFAAAPFKALAANTYYAKVTAEVSTASTGLGTVYAGNPPETSQTLASGTSGGTVTATLGATPNDGYYLKGWNTDDSDNVLSGSDANPYTPSVKVSSSNNETISYTYYAVFKPCITCWAEINVVYASSNTGTGSIMIDGNYRNKNLKSRNDCKEGGGDITFTLKAEADPGCKFMGWSETDPSGAYVSTNNPYDCKVNSSSTDSSAPAVKTLYAVFMKSPSITISVEASGFGQGETVVFDVFQGSETKPLYTVPVRIASSSQVVLKDLPIATYRVVPNVWAMNYDITPASASYSTGVSVEDDTEFKFVLSGKSTAKEYDEKSKVNWK